MRLAIPRKEAEAVVDRAAHASRWYGSTVHQDTAAVRFDQADDRLCQLGFAAGRQPRQAHALARVHVEVDIREPPLPGEVTHREHRLAGDALRHIPGCLRQRRPDDRGLTDHGIDDLLLPQPLDRCLQDHATVAKDRDRIADLVDLVEVMRDVEEADPCVVQVSNLPEQQVDLRGFELGRRLIEDDEARAQPQRANDLDQLALPGRQLRCACIDLRLDAPLIEKAPALCSDRFPAQPGGRGL